MATASHIHVRQMEVGDFTFVRDLAATQPNFTVPPPYVLWLLLKVKDAICLVAEHNIDGPLAYLLAVPIEAPLKALHIWQLAASDSGQQRRAPLVLLDGFVRAAQQLRVRHVGFSTVPDSSALRLIRRYSLALLSRTPEPLSMLPSLVCPNEKEYRVELPPSRRSQRMQRKPSPGRSR